MTKKFDEFIAELKALCKKHNIVLSTYGYDSIQVWDADDVYDTGHFVHCGIEDLTKKDSDL